MIRGRDWLFLLAAVAGAALLFQLGTWQVNRLAWKQGLIAAMEAAIEGRAEPVSPGEAAARFSAGPSLDYVLVAGEGEYAGPTRWLYAIVDGKPGWHAVNAVALKGGGKVLLDRGALPDEMRGQLPEPSGAVSFRGFARRPEMKAGLFTPASHPGKGIFFWRDAAGMGGEGVYPFLVEALPQAGAEGWPRPEKPDPSALPNNHLSYAVTWFSLSGLLLLLTGYFLWTRRKTSTAKGGA